MKVESVREGTEQLTNFLTLLYHKNGYKIFVYLEPYKVTYEFPQFCFHSRHLI
jgi:hypothetical protein